MIAVSNKVKHIISGTYIVYRVILLSLNTHYFKKCKGTVS